MPTIDTRILAASTDVPAAANQDFAEVDARAPQTSSAAVGWDPYEVWQRMIKQARERRADQSAK